MFEDLTIGGVSGALIFGALGFWLIRAGRRAGNILWALIGLAMMVYPYFVSNGWVTWGIGFALCGVAYQVRE